MGRRMSRSLKEQGKERSFEGIRRQIIQKQQKTGLMQDRSTTQRLGKVPGFRGRSWLGPPEEPSISHKPKLKGHRRKTITSELAKLESRHDTTAIRVQTVYRNEADVEDGKKSRLYRDEYRKASTKHSRGTDRQALSQTRKKDGRWTWRVEAEPISFPI